MSLSESRAATTRLTVEAGPVTEVFILDDRFNLVDRQVGHSEFNLRPGLYTVKFKAGDLVKQTDVVIEPGAAPILVRRPVMDIPSSAPLGQARTTRIDVMNLASQRSRTATEQLGQGAELFLFVWGDARSAAPQASISLHAVSGLPLLEIAPDANPGPEGVWLAVTVALDPGTYRMRVPTRSAGELEQLIVVMEGWQTQVFLSTREIEARDPDGEWYRETVPDLSQAAILMAKRGQGFDPERDDYLWTEQARRAFGADQGRVGNELLQHLLHNKFDNPLLGIFGMHLLLMQQAGGNADIERYETILGNLHNLVPNHPDVLALAAKVLDDHPDGGSAALKELVPAHVSTPPMLRRSWEYLVRATVRRPRLIAADSLAARAVARLWGDSVWSVWQLWDEDPGPEPLFDLLGAIEERTMDLARESYRGDSRLPTYLIMSDVLAGLSSQAKSGDTFETFIREKELNYGERALLRYLTSLRPAASGMSATDLFKEDPDTLRDYLTNQALVEATGLPVASVTRALMELARKIGLRDPGGSSRFGSSGNADDSSKTGATDLPDPMPE